MSAERPSLKDSLAPLSEDIHLLGDLLGQVIREQEGQSAFQLEERVRKAAIARRRGENAEQQIVEAIEGASLEQKRILTKAFSNYFQLVNIAEDQQRVRVLRERERQSKVAESIDAALAQLHKEGWTDSEFLELLEKLEIDLVLTAHPTEAKRQDFLFKLHELSHYVDERDRINLTPREQQRVRLGILAGIEEMWQTSVTRAKQPSVMDEVEFGLYFMTTVVMRTVIKLHREMIRQLDSYFGMEVPELPNFIHFSSWIGGDRDGHPYVTAEVTRETVERMRAAVRAVYRQEIQRLRDRLTQTMDEVQPSQDLMAAVGDSPDLSEAYPRQPYRQMMALIDRKLEGDKYQSVDVLLQDLRLVESSLLGHQGIHAAQDGLWDLIQMVRIFGLHLMPLDFREDARRLLKALDEIFKELEIHPAYLELEEDQRRILLVDQLSSWDPPEFSADDFSEDTASVLEALATTAELMDRYGDRTFKSLIGSMSQRASDILAMLWLARAFDLGSRVDVVPLFETLQDLARAPGEMDYLFGLEVYREQLASRGHCQQIMIGYSDSAKDGGYLASNWSLFRAQEDFADVVGEHNLCLELFHGRGGSIGRGGGPTNRAIQTQPQAAMQSGMIRMTEQGEVIAYRYGREEIADRHLQQVVHAALMATGSPQIEPAKQEWRRAMDQLAKYGRQAFRDLVYEGKGFLDYWKQATPFHELEELPIGSRPATRREGGFEAVRAIPWVFSWMQCRAILPSWFGIGTAIENLQGKRPEAEEILRTMYQEWPFFKLLVENVELDLAKVELGIARQYSQLVQDQDLRQRFDRKIQAEYQRTKDALLRITGRDELLDWMPVIQHSIEQRNPYVDPLNFIQVSLLDELRGLEPGTDRHQAVLDAVLATINGVAAGMKNTG